MPTDESSAAHVHPWGGRGSWFWECPGCGQKSGLMTEQQARTELPYHLRTCNGR